jgi:hypothetical protein
VAWSSRKTARVVGFGIGSSMLGVGWPPATTVAPATVTMSCPVIFGWTSRLPEPFEPQDQDLAAAAGPVNVMAGDVRAGDLR